MGKLMNLSKKLESNTTRKAEPTNDYSEEIKTISKIYVGCIRRSSVENHTINNRTFISTDSEKLLNNKIRRTNHYQNIDKRSSARNEYVNFICNNDRRCNKDDNILDKKFSQENNLSTCDPTVPPVEVTEQNYKGSSYSTPLTKKEEDELRNSYLSLMQRGQWKAELVAVAETMINELSANETKRFSLSSVFTAPKLASILEITVQFNNKDFVFNSEAMRAICIGRHTQCDVVLPPGLPPWKCSRLHAVIYMLPRRKQFIIADVGSYHGIRTKWRSSKGPLDSSLPRTRRLLIYSINDAVRITLGTQSLFITGAELGAINVINP